MRRALITAMIAVITLLSLAGPAQAHNVLISSDPADGAKLKASPSEVTLTFDQAIQPGDVNQIAVTGPGGTRWTEAPVQVDSNETRTKVRPLGPKGAYTIGYRVVSADGHPVSGQLRFELTEPGGGTPVEREGDPAAQDDASGGLPLWAWIVGAGGLLAAGLVLALRLGKAPTK